MSQRSFRRAAARNANRRRAAGLAVALGSLAVPTGASAATLTVTNNLDSGAGSLRQAIDDANNTATPDTIDFAANVTGTINVTGNPMTIQRSLTIDGPGADRLKLVKANGYPTWVNTNFTDTVVEIEGLALEGHTSGPGSGGGALRAGSGASTTVRNCVISGSTATGPGGGIFVENTTLAVIDSTIAGNSASSGGGIYGRDATVQVRGSTISGNTGVVQGGGISMAETASVAKTSLAVTGSTVSGNKNTSGGGYGGGISVTSADGPTTITGSTVSGNSTVERGAGLYFGYGDSLAIDSSTFSTNNSAGRGGGLDIYAPSGPTTITNSTIAGNTASSAGGGIYSFGYFDKPVTISNSTIATNVVAGGTGGGIFRFGYDGTLPGYEGPDEIALRSTVVANNLSSAGGMDLDEQFSVAAASAPRARSSAPQSGATVTETAPGTNKLNAGITPLGALADNGGPTLTMLPPAAGALIDAGAAEGSTTDQRGLARTVRQPGGPTGGDGTDIGAVELRTRPSTAPSSRPRRSRRSRAGRS